VIGGVRNPSDRLAHRENEDGSLPRALTEDKSHFEPHHSTNDNSHASGAHKKPGLLAKLNPKVDADGDGKAGFMK